MSKGKNNVVRLKLCQMDEPLRSTRRSTDPLFPLTSYELTSAALRMSEDDDKNVRRTGEALLENTAKQCRRKMVTQKDKINRFLPVGAPTLFDREKNVRLYARDINP